jgi:uncharacterized protein
LSKRGIYILGIITLLIFPIPAFLYLYFFEDYSLEEFIRWNEIWKPETVLGMNLGIVYAFFALVFMGAPVFEKLPNRVEMLVKNMRLNAWDALFLSICAGVGEELLFRAGMQSIFGPWITSVFFVAIHGYLNPMNWRMSLYGLIILPFIFLISFGYNTFGQWFSIGAHFSYDFVLFMALISDTKNDQLT